MSKCCVWTGLSVVSVPAYAPTGAALAGAPVLDGCHGGTLVSPVILKAMLVLGYYVGRGYVRAFSPPPIKSCGSFI